MISAEPTSAEIQQRPNDAVVPVYSCSIADPRPDNGNTGLVNVGNLNQGLVLIGDFNLGAVNIGNGRTGILRLGF